MTEIWFRELGFYSNPFSIKPAAFHDNAIGAEKIIDDVSYGILNKKLVLVEGESGNGKSTLLKRLLNDFGGKKQVVYYSCNRMDAHLNVKMLLNGRYGFLGHLFDMKPKDMIFLLDEAQELGSKDYERLYSYYQEGYIKSIVLVGKGIKKNEIVPGLKTQLEEVGMHTMNEDIAVRIIRKRIGELSILPDLIIRKIYQRSGNNIRVMLKNCEELCKRAVETGRKRITEDFLKQFYQEKENPNGEKKEEKKTLSEEKKEEKKSMKPVIIDRRQEKKEEGKSEEKVEKEKATPIKEDKKEEPKSEERKRGKAHVYRPDEYKGMNKASAEELLNKPTDEIFGDEQYY